ACSTRLAGTLGIGRTFLPAIFGFAAEIPAFALSSHAFRKLGAEGGSEISIGQELASTAITLGVLKVFGAIGDHAFKKIQAYNELGMASRFAGLARFTQLALPQVTTFLGMLGAHRMEEILGLRQPVEGATTVTDTIASMFSLHVGSKLGHGILGERFQRWQQ